MSFDDAYDALTDHDDDTRWAYGTGFSDPLAGVPAAVPDGVDRADLAAYCLMLGDDALIMSHRLQQWVTRAPELEDEMALANIGLDLLGQARLLLSRAGEVEPGAATPGGAMAGAATPGGAMAGAVSLGGAMAGAVTAGGAMAGAVTAGGALAGGAVAGGAVAGSVAGREPVDGEATGGGAGGSRSPGGGRDEDALAFLREPAEFRNVRLAERVDEDFAHLVARLLVFATWRLALLDRLTASRDPILAAIGAKGVKETTYHREYAAGWVVRLGDGTDVSHTRMRAAAGVVEPMAGELFHPHAIELRLAAAGVAVDPATLREEYDGVLAEVHRVATLPPPPPTDPVPAGTGRDGVHGPELTEILTEMQELARAVPGGVW